MKQTDKVKKELAQCTEAEQIAWKMQEFQKGYEDTSVVETYREDQKTAQFHSSKVSNCVAEANDAIIYLKQFGKCPPHYEHSLKHLRSLVEVLKKMHRTQK